MDTCLITDFEKVCRICMKFDKTFLAINSFKIIDMIVACASVQIWENDDLPNQICQACFLQLQNTINFKHLCKTSDNTFRQIIQQSKINILNNESNFHSVKDEKFENYDHSLENVKEEDFSDDIKNENSLENVKIISHNEDNSKKVETSSILKITNKDKLDLNKIPTELEKVIDETIKDETNVIESFTCEKCNKEFKTVWNLGSHMHRHHRVKAIKCKKCNHKYYHPLTLKCHEDIKHNDHICMICNKKFSSIYKLKEHKRCRHAKDGSTPIRESVACHICGKLMKKRSVKFHMAIHKDDRDKITCDICSKTFARQDGLTRHMKRVHSNETPACNHLCNICGHASRSAFDLRRHLITHSTERPYACDHCDKSFRREDNLKEHIAHVHLNVRKYQCKFCSQAFHERKGLRNHERRHTGEKPHKCEVCGKAFIQKYALKVHTKIHTNSREKIAINLTGVPSLMF